ncbi:hypothetical protein Cme02nite_14170 [Catellatospora methionotrophica]|uniref:Uncharacterized protein n=1 Tax=Catellatospora methionotrophica TaxID=121620 RepID=A0A8J3L667_9ACTN|nr:hypothetical protein [Catellatospora methionotrophica]GIG13085.1 hypothetical protein Cme02nite_14170 [Catellatospora methionotrophica]
MGWFRRRGGSPADRPADPAAVTHLEQFAQSRRGVEAFIEPRTTVTGTTVILIAHDGEWTRRRMPNPQAVRQFAQRLSMPVYDVQLVGYPQRMRDFNARQKLRPAE